jgi:uncharacterized protein (DUF302 family)
MTLQTCTYCLTRAVPGTFVEVVAATRVALAAEGFGVLTEIDVQTTFENKLGVKTRPYLILGACNPSIAHRALQLDPGIGTLLPCNVVVAESESGTIEVAAIDPKAMFAVVGNAAMAPIVDEVSAKLRTALDALAK